MEIKLRDVTKYYYDEGKSTKGLEDVNLEFKTDGSWVAITGESGAGKSTLIKILTGLEDFDEGDIYFDGQPLSGMSAAQRQKMYTDNISFVFQDYNLVESVTSEENLSLALIKQGFSVKDAKKKALEALKKVGLEKQAKMRASKLSGGERQRVAIARSLALDTQVIIFDEPTGNLDNDTSRQIIDLIESVKGNRLIVYVTHDYDEVKQYVTRHITLADGHVINDENVAHPSGEAGSKEKDSRKKFGWASYLYASCLFSFRRIGRFISTLIVLALSTAGVLGAAYGYSEVLSLTSALTTEITTNYAESYSTVSVQGNRVQIRKTSASDSDFEPKENDFYTDKSDYLASGKIYLYSHFTVEEALVSNYAFQNLASTFPTPYADSEWKLVEGTAPDFANGESALVLYDDNSYYGNYAYYMSLYKNKLLDKDADLLAVGMYDIGNRGSLPDKFKNILAACPKTKITGIYSSKQGQYSRAQCLYCSKDLISSYTDYRAAYLKDFISFSYKDQSNYRSLYYYYNDRSVSTSDIIMYTPDGEIMGLSYNMFNQYPDLVNETSDYLMLPSIYKGQDLTFSYKGISFKSSQFNVKYVDVDYSKAIYKDNFFIESFYFSSVYNDLGVIQSYYFDTPSNAELAYKEVSSLSNYKSVFYPLVSQTDTSTNKIIPMEKRDVMTRITLLSQIVMTVFFMLLLMLVIQGILNRFYYRKDYDQMVLSYIGYSRKDTIIVNLISFVFVSLVCILVIYPCFILNVPGCLALFNTFPQLMVLSAFLNLAFAVFIALPRRAKGGKK